jgi:hypothetical protein
MALQTTTQSFQKVVGSAFSAEGAFSTTLVIAGAGATATIGTGGITGVLSPGDILIASSTTGGFTSGTTQILIQSIGYNAGGTGATCSFTGVTPSGACTVSLVSSATSTFASPINIYAVGDRQAAPSTTRVVSIQGGFTTNGTSTWTPLNRIVNGGSVELIGAGASASGPFNVTVQCREVYTLNTSTGAIVRGGSANVLDLALRSGANYATIATLESGDVAHFNGLNITAGLTSSGGTFATPCSLVIYNNSGSDLIADVVAAITL